MVYAGILSKERASQMSKDPAVLFYTSDFLTGTFTMTDDQVGKYIRLLCLQHQKGFLCEKDMLKICKTYDEDIYSKFIKEGDNYYNARMKTESDRRKKYSESRAENRKQKDEKPLKTNKTKTKNISKTYVKHMETEIENETEIKTEFNECRKVYFEFYEKQIGAKPTFNGSQGANLKKLIGCIKTSLTNNHQETTPENITQSFATLLQYLPDWYKNHLDVNIIYSKYDAIIGAIRKSSGATEADLWKDIINERARQREGTTAGG